MSNKHLISLTPGFSRVVRTGLAGKPFQRLVGAGETVETVLMASVTGTGLKPGV